MNLGLSLHHAIKYLPIYNTFLLISSVVVGSIFFQEYATFHPIAFPIGCLLLVIGIRQLAHQQMARVDPMLLTPDGNLIADRKRLEGNNKTDEEGNGNGNANSNDTQDGLFMDNSTLLINDDASTGYSKADLLILRQQKFGTVGSVHQQIRQSNYPQNGHVLILLSPV